MLPLPLLILVGPPMSLTSTLAKPPVMVALPPTLLPLMRPLLQLTVRLRAMLLNSTEANELRTVALPWMSRTSTRPF